MEAEHCAHTMIKWNGDSKPGFSDPEFHEPLSL